MTLNRKVVITSVTPGRRRAFRAATPVAVLAVIVGMINPWLSVESSVYATHTNPAYLAAIALNAASGSGTTFGPETAVNTITNRIYVADSKTGSVSVVDGTSRVVIAEVPVGVKAIRVVVNEVTNRI